MLMICLAGDKFEDDDIVSSHHAECDVTEIMIKEEKA